MFSTVSSTCRATGAFLIWSESGFDGGVSGGDDAVGVRAEGAAQERKLVQPALRVQDAVSAGVAAAGDLCAEGGGLPDGGKLILQKRLQDCIREAAAADQIPNRDQRGDPDGAALSQLRERLIGQIRAMLDGVDPAEKRCADSAVAVGVRHDGKSRVVRDGDHGADLAFFQRLRRS